MAVDNDINAGVTNDKSPGGVFQRDSQQTQASDSANVSARKAQRFAEESEAWAVGLDAEGNPIPLEPGDDVPDLENNSKYWAEQSKEHAESGNGHSEDASQAADRARSWANFGSGFPYDDNLGTATDNANYWSSQSASSATQAETAETGAVTAQTAAELAETGAETAETNAATSATAAATSATGASASATAAATSATEASTSATSAATSATSAATSATAASTSATEAATSATAAETAETGAETAETGAETAQAAAETAETNAEASSLESEGFAVGEQDGVPVTSGTYFENNSKYYSEQAANIDLPGAPDAGTEVTNYVLNVATDGTDTWAVLPDAQNPVTGGDGITVSATDVISITDSGVTTVKINDNAVTNAKLGTNAVQTGNINISAVTNEKLGANAVTTAKIADGTILEADLNITNTGTAGQLLTLADAATGTFTWVTETTTGTIAGGDGISVVTSGNTSTVALADDGVITAKLNDLAVTTAKIANTSVSSGKLADSAVTNAKLADNAVEDANLNASNTGTAGQLLSADGDGTFTWVDADGNTPYTASDGITLASDDFSLTDSGVTTVKLNDNAVTTAKLANDAVEIDNINTVSTAVPGSFLLIDNDSAMSWGTIMTSLENLSDTNIPAGGPSTRSLLEYSPTEDTWNSTAIDEVLNLFEMFDVEITNAAEDQFLRYNVTDARWENETVNIPAVLTGSSTVAITNDVLSVPDDAITTTQLGTNAVEAVNLASDAVTTDKLNDMAVTGAKIADLAVGTANLASNAVTSDKITDNNVTADELNVTGDGTSGQYLTSDGDGSFSWTTSSGGGTDYTAGTGLDLTGTEFSVADGGITATQLASDAVTTAKLEDNAVTLAKMADGSVDSPELVSGAVTTVKIADANVTTAKIANTAVTADKVATNIPISTWSDVNTLGVNNGQVLGYNGTTWVPINQSGGGDTDNSRLVITPSPTFLTAGDTDTTVLVTLSIGNAIIGETISGQSVTVTDPTGHSIAVSGSGNDFSFVGNGNNVGNYVIRGSATFTLTGGTSTVHSATVNLRVIADNTDWYQQVTATQPTDVTAMTDNGIYNSPEVATINGSGNADSTAKAYLALPTRSSGYTFNVGFLPASDLINHGVISSSYTLYQVNDADFDDRLTGDLQLTITEN